MNEDNNVEVKQEDSISVIKEEYESKLAQQKQEYEQQISQLKANHIDEIRQLMRTGNVPDAEEYQEEKREEELIMEQLRKKYIHKR